MKKHFEQAIAFDRDSPLNQRVGLGKKYNELVDEYNALVEKYNKAVGIEVISADETVSDDVTIEDQPQTDNKEPINEAQEDQPQTDNKPAKNKRG